MGSVLVGLLVTIVLSIVILLAVALPRLREGSRILSPDGERLARHTGRRIARKATAIAGPAAAAAPSRSSGRRRAGREPGPSRGRVPSHRNRSFRTASRHAAPHHGAAVLPPTPGPPPAQPAQPDGVTSANGATQPAPPADQVIDLRDGVSAVEPGPDPRHA